MNYRFVLRYNYTMITKEEKQNDAVLPE